MELTALYRGFIDHLTFLCCAASNSFLCWFSLCSVKQMKVAHRFAFAFAVSALSIPIY
jgi:hypothetical protein